MKNKLTFLAFVIVFVIGMTAGYSAIYSSAATKPSTEMLAVVQPYYSKVSTKTTKEYTYSRLHSERLAVLECELSEVVINGNTKINTTHPKAKMPEVDVEEDGVIYSQYQIDDIQPTKVQLLHVENTTNELIVNARISMCNLLN